MDSIAILILAAGKSSRMGSIKQLEKIKDKTLIDIIIKKANLLKVDKIYCVLGANSEKIKEQIEDKNIDILENTNFEKGLSTSIILGVEYIQSTIMPNKIMILLADQPALEVTYLKEMIALSKQYKSKIIATKYASSFGVPIIIPQPYFNKLNSISGDKGAKDFLEKESKNIVTPKIKPNIFDIDTKEDLTRYRNSLN